MLSDSVTASSFTNHQSGNAKALKRVLGQMGTAGNTPTANSCTFLLLLDQIAPVPILSNSGSCHMTTSGAYVAMTKPCDDHTA